MMFRLDDRAPADGTLIYSRSSFGFLTIPRPAGGIGSVTVNEVELMVNEDGQIVYVCGYCPFQSWNPATLMSPPYSVSSLSVDVPSGFTPGVAVGVSRAEQRWRVDVDETSRWLRLSGAELGVRDHAVWFAPGAVAEISDHRLLTVWLRLNFA